MMSMIWNNNPISSPSNYSSNSNSPVSGSSDNRRDKKARRALDNMLDWHTISDRIFEKLTIGSSSSKKVNYAHVLTISSSSLLQNKSITVGSSSGNKNVCYWNMKYKVSSKQLALPILQQQQQQVDDHPNNEKSDDNPHNSTNNNVSLSTYMAVLDDVMTWTIGIGDEMEQRPSLFSFRPSIGRPGVSVSFRTQWVNNNNNNNSKLLLSSEKESKDVTTTTQIDQDKDVSSQTTEQQSEEDERKAEEEEEDVLIHVSVKKIGRILGFVDGEIYKCTNGSSASPQLFVTSSHTKYLPMGWFYAFVMHPVVFRMVKAICYFLPASHDSKDKNNNNNTKNKNHEAISTTSSPLLSNRFSLKDMFDSTYLKIHGCDNNKSNDNDDPSKGLVAINEKDPGVLVATFTFDPIVHANPMGAFHGGCQAILMEIAGTKFIQNNCRHLLLSQQNDADNNNNNKGNNSDNKNPGSDIQLQSINMDYLSAFAPSSSSSFVSTIMSFLSLSKQKKNPDDKQHRQIQYYAQLVSHIPNSSTIVRVQAISLKRKRLISQADLNFIVSSPK